MAYAIKDLGLKGLRFRERGVKGLRLKGLRV